MGNPGSPGFAGPEEACPRGSSTARSFAYLYLRVRKTITWVTEWCAPSLFLLSDITTNQSAPRLIGAENCDVTLAEKLRFRRRGAMSKTCFRPPSLRTHLLSSSFCSLSTLASSRFSASLRVESKRKRHNSLMSGHTGRVPGSSHDTVATGYKQCRPRQL